VGVASRAFVVRESPRVEPSCHFCHVVAREATRRRPVAGPGFDTWPDLDRDAWRAVRRLGFFMAVAVGMGVASRAFVVRELPRVEPSCHLCHVVAREATWQRRVAGSRRQHVARSRSLRGDWT